MRQWWDRLTAATKPRVSERKMATQALFAFSPLAEMAIGRKGFTSLATEGFAHNPVVYRCVRMIAEGAARVPFEVRDGSAVVSEHPLLDLLRRPNRRDTGGGLLEAGYSYLQTAGNAYFEAVLSDGRAVGLYGLRPDRMTVVAGRDGWPTAYDYAAGGRTRRLALDADPVPRVLHMRLFHPLDDHYGLSPLEAAQVSLDTHNAATRWNKALLDNAARPSGALVYSAANGNMTEDQFARLKAELETGFAGAVNAGRPMVLEGGLDWKTLAFSPRDMDFLEAKNAAAREIALAFGVPPMLLGIPGDNTYANYAEASRALWRQTLIPLVAKMAGALGDWLGPAFGGVELVPDFDVVEALASERAADWERVGNASFLTDAEKRELLGFGTP